MIHHAFIVAGIITMIFVISIVIGIFAWKLSHAPIPSRCSQMPWPWAQPNCVFLVEDHYDSTIVKPAAALYLGDFQYDSTLSGGAVCRSMWYAYRYVRLSDGAYGPLGEWTQAPIYAGAPYLPYAPSTASPTVGQATCNFNRPTIITVGTLEHGASDGYLLNLHRQLDVLDPAASGSVIGNLITNSGMGTSSWADIMYNVNTKSNCCDTRASR